MRPRFRESSQELQPVAMLTPLIARIIWAAGIVGWYVIRYPFQRRAARQKVARAAARNADRVVLAIAALGQFVIPAVYAATGWPRGADYGFSPWLAWLGVILLVAALVLFRITHVHLGRNWSISLETREEHALVTGGVYSWVRHPMYSSFLLSALAQLCLLQNWFAGPSGLVGFAILFFFRVNREEGLMIDTFGQQYRDYSRRTARIVPWLY
jgi:protein-S-isoprenylcysteine O-methyltransferase Ste14